MDSIPPIQLRDQVASSENTYARSAPYWVRGRDHETAHILSTLEGIPCAITIIAGSPGSGKSSLLAHIQAHAQYLGLNVVNLRRQDLANEVTLTDALRKVTRAEQATPGGQAGNRDKKVKLNIRVAEFEWGRDRAQHRDNRRPLTWHLALDHLGRGKGTIITLDEVQRLEELRDNSDQAKLIGDFLNKLHSEHMHRPQRRLAFIGCGLSHTQDVINRFRMTRVENNHVVRLGPLSLAASIQILDDHCNAPTATGETLPQPPPELIKELAESSGGCAHHLAWAGCRVQQRALQIMDRADHTWTDDDMEYMRRRAVRDRAGLYISRLPTPNDRTAHPATRPLAFTLATAIETYGRALPESLVMNLDAQLREADRRDQGPLTTLIEKGIIERREGAHQFLTASDEQRRNLHYAFPIHSMGQWLRAAQTEPGSDWNRARSEEVLDQVHRAGQEITSIQEWQWDYDAEICAVPEERRLPDDGIDATDRNNPQPATSRGRRLRRAISQWFDRVRQRFGTTTARRPNDAHKETDR